MAHAWSQMDSTFQLHLLPPPLSHSTLDTHNQRSHEPSYLKIFALADLSIQNTLLLHFNLYFFNSLGLCSNVSFTEDFDNHILLHPYLFISLMEYTMVSKFTSCSMKSYNHNMPSTKHWWFIGVTTSFFCLGRKHFNPVKHTFLIIQQSIYLFIYFGLGKIYSKNKI